MWFVYAVQVILSIALIVALLFTIVWLRSSAEDNRQIKRLVERMGLAIQQMRADLPSALKGRSGGSMYRQGGAEVPPMPLEDMSESRRTAGLTVAMELPVIEHRVVSVTRDDDEVHTRSTPKVNTPVTLSVKIGDEVLDLDADTVARIEALREDVNAGRLDGSLLQRVLDAGFAATEDDTRPSGEITLDEKPPPTKPTGS